MKIMTRNEVIDLLKKKCRDFNATNDFWVTLLGFKNNKIVKYTVKSRVLEIREIFGDVIETYCFEDLTPDLI